jgi:LmbE family N-acetylglucosaminyl deacetylase
MVRLEKRLCETSYCMMKLDIGRNGSKPLTILCLGAHSDDIEIGCGGALLHLKQSERRPNFHWVVFSAVGKRGEEARKAAELFTADCNKEIILKEYRDGFLPYNGAEIKDFFEDLKSRVNPDLIFTHWHGDAHQDHRLICELTWNTFRNHLILEYEIPKYDGDMGRPNVFVPLEAALPDEKVDFLLEAFESQRTKPWFEPQLFKGLMRLRGMESNSPSGYAEAFHCRKLVVSSAD